MVLMQNFGDEPAELQSAMRTNLLRVAASGTYVLGSEVRQFEQDWALACDAFHGIGTANGMDAIEISLRALGIGPGDEVITTAMTAFATVLGILRTGADAVLADIEPNTALMSAESVRRCITRRTRAIVLVHLYGQMCDMGLWATLCGEHGLLLVEDCAQAHGGAWQGRRAGSFGEAGAFSFYPTKNLGAMGDAGMIVTRDANLAATAACLRNYGQTEPGRHGVPGLNSRLDEMQAAVLSARLPWLARFNACRREIATAYRNRITNAAVTLLDLPVDREAHVHHLFVVLCEERDRLQRHLLAKGVQSRSHYPFPVHLHEPCQSMRRDPLGLGHSESHARRCISLPLHPQLTPEDLTAVLDAVNAFEA